jgi:hypothetical protein
MVPISTAIIYIVDRTPYGLRYLEGPLSRVEQRYLLGGHAE